MTQLQLFDTPAPPKVRKYPVSGAGSVTWTKLKAPKTARLPQCDHCVLDAHNAGGPIPMRARVVRSQNGEKVYLCYPHASAAHAPKKFTGLQVL